MRTASRWLLLVALSWPMGPLLACYGESPPAGYESVRNPAPSHPGDACPDLTGTFDLAGHPLAGEIVDEPAPAGHGLPVRLSLVPRANRTEAWWHVPRPALLAFAADLAARDPDRYFEWQSIALRQDLPDELRFGGAAWRAALSRLGPPLPIFAGLAGQRCEENWMLVSIRDVSSGGSDDETGHTGGTDDQGDGGRARAREQEIWLGRASDGALLVKRVVFELLHYSIYATATQSIRLPPGETSWARIPPAAPEDPTPVTAADLPPAHDPSTRAARCPAEPEHVVAFSQRLMTRLPAGAEIVRLEVDHEVRPDPLTGCPALIVEVGFAGSSAESLAECERLVRADPEVRSIDTRPPEPGARRPSQSIRAVLEPAR